VSLESALYQYLSAEEGLADVSPRIYPVVAPQGAALPYIVHRRVSETRMPHLGGSSGMVRTRVQFDTYASTPDESIATSEILRGLLDGWRNDSMGTDELNVLSINHDDRQTIYEPPSDGSDTGRHRVSDDYRILYGETIPSFAASPPIQ